MRERPILFSGPLVRAILEGRKTQTRRVVTGRPLQWLRDGFLPQYVAHPDNGLCRFGYQGDRLWVKESHAFASRWDRHRAAEIPAVDPQDSPKVWYAADGGSKPTRRRPSIHMPRWASRIDLEIAAVRIERLRAITEEDAQAEGVPKLHERYPVFAAEQRVAGLSTTQFPHLTCFVAIWDELNGDRDFGWSTNPWVWVVSFRRVRP